MSRLEFRERVTLPRPRAAILMVALASATLAISGQMMPWALALAAAALFYAAARARRPAAWQQQPLLLNLGLVACIACGAALWLQGQLALLALAHFALLTQGLQLIDARPRRSEFLLVALAVFQVTMAANLTDSAFYPPMLVLFTVSTVWTLIVHTLRAEALEAGEAAAAQRALSTGLLRTTLVASVVAIALSALLFPILPRVRSGALFDNGFGQGVARAGFSDRVELGDIGRIRMDPTVVLRVETIEGVMPPADERYWRGLAFDHFDGRRWSVTPNVRRRVTGDPEIGVDLSGPRQGDRMVQRIAREEVDVGVLFSAGSPAGLRGGVGHLEWDANRSLYAYATVGKRVDYSVSSYLRPRPDPKLEADRTELPREGGERFLQLPEMDPRVGALAAQIVADASTDAGRLRAMQTYLRDTGRYTDTPPDFGDDRSPLEGFLLERSEGHCEYFASAMVVLARNLGIPARLVNGFAAGHENRLGGFVEVSQSDAHAWVEAHFEKAGWVRYDPTPPDLRMAGADLFRGSRSFSELAGAMELWWFRNVVDFDRGHQARALRKAWFAWQDWRKDRPASGAESGGSGSRRGSLPPVPEALRWAGVAVLAAILVLADIRRRRRPTRALPAFYRRALGMLRGRGLTRAPSHSAREFAREAEGVLPPAGAEAFVRLTEAYLRERFGRVSAGAMDRELRALRDSLRP